MVDGPERPVPADRSQVPTLRGPGRPGATGPAQESWVIAVGDELLAGHTADTNSAWLADRLRRTPFPCRRIVVVPDDEPAIAAELAAAAAGPAARVFCCGGLGPTPDDVTLAAVAAAFRVRLREHPVALAHIGDVVARMHRAGWVPSPAINPGNRKMALVPEGAEVLRNRVGMAPPVVLGLPGAAGRRLLVLPGVPIELRTVVLEEVLPVHLAGEPAVAVEEVAYRGIGESSFYSILRTLAATFPDVRFGSYPLPAAGELVIRATARDPARAQLAAAELRRLAEGLRPPPSPAG